jgi:hypothetical protein
MNDSAQTIQQPANVSVEQRLEALTPSDLNDLCDATEAAIENGGGFGWVKVPARDSMERYWQGVIAAPTRWLFIARLDGVICGTTQVVLPPSNNEAQGHTVTLTTNFIAPWRAAMACQKCCWKRWRRHAASAALPLSTWMCAKPWMRRSRSMNPWATRNSASIRILCAPMARRLKVCITTK